MSKTYRGSSQPALRNVSLHVEQGHCVCLVGRSGSGKSTLLRTVNRLVTPDVGTVFVGGSALQTLEPTTLRRRIGYVIQQGGLFPHLNVGENIGLLPRLMGADAPAIKDRVRRLLEQVQLESDIATRMPAALSGGQAQRVSIARALALDPEYLLLDEPFSALDPLTRTELWTLLAALRAEKPRTLLMVTHDMREALTLGDQVAVLDEGTLLQVDTPQALVGSPANDYVHALVQSAAGVSLVAR